ncbi:MAG: potassium channel family protein [Rhodoglobus sp.]
MTRLVRWERATEYPLLGLGIAFLVAYALPIIDPKLFSDWITVFLVVELVAWSAFAIDLVVRIVIANDRWLFIRRHPLDLAAVILPILRPLQALRALSILFLSARGLHRILRNRVLSYVVIAALGVWFIAGLAVTQAERDAPGANIHDVAEGWWWAFITMATVGYGDVFPVTVEGRLVAVGLVVTGVALIGTVTAYIASWFAAQTRAAEEAIQAEIDESEDKIDALSREVSALQRLIAERLPLVEAKPEPTAPHG